MPAFTVTLDVDGEVVIETIIGAVDAQEAIKKAMKRHPTLVLGASPLEIQMELDEIHPDQEEIEVDPGYGSIDPDQPEDGPIDPVSDLLKNGTGVFTREDAEAFMRDTEPLPEITPDGPFEEAAANPFSETAPDPVHAEAVLAEMRGSDPDGLDS